ncbi:alcohol dehydrogenase catalytic domain-containing protein [Anaerofustis stercorihominis]|nr:alcohol dehydrogenase catalytic domain-containing protein [Anaerofustis stercorihominis]MCR2033094.1 alcohol dehydrogenase catalytic domain-containing protein [Anaerofustis stercorihominis]
MLYEPGDLRLIECERPKAGKGEVLIKNEVSLTCGSDVKSYIRGYAKHTPPYNIGHECSGVVAEVGEGVTKFKVGDRVVAHNSAPCNECYYCKKGIHCMCENLITNQLKNGGFSEYQLIPEIIVKQNMFHIPDDMSFKQAALLEPFACAAYGVSEIPVEQGDYVAVNGCGPSGLMFIRLLYLKGARVIACDKSKVRLEAAKKLGAHDIINIEEVDDQVQAVKDLTPGKRGVDAAVEAAGSVKVWQMSINMVRPGGFALLYGGTKAGEELTVDTKLLHYSQITIKGLYHTTPLYVNQAFELLKMKVIDEKDFLYNEYKLENVKEALMNHHEGNVIKNYITYN